MSTRLLLLLLLLLLQICSHSVATTDRLTPYLQGLDVPAVVLLMAQRLVAAAAAAAVPATNALRFAAAPKPRALEEGRLGIGMALAHVAQRMGHAHVNRRGWFGSQQVREASCWLSSVWRCSMM
jgi:hypothetical protein